VTDEEYLGQQVGIVCVLLFLLGFAAVAEHPEWFA
jgi:hypothetical protein